MIGMTITLQGDNAWPDLKEKPFVHLGNEAQPIKVAVLDGGMASGRPSVAIRLDLPDGQTVVAETTARLFCTAARAIMGKYPGLFDDN
jgi:hypothetical protein